MSLEKTTAFYDHQGANSDYEQAEASRERNLDGEQAEASPEMNLDGGKTNPENGYRENGFQQRWAAYLINTLISPIFIMGNRVLGNSPLIATILSHSSAVGYWGAKTGCTGTGKTFGHL